MTLNSLPNLLTTDEVAEYLGVPKRTLEQWRVKKEGPPHMKLGKHARYTEPGLLRWITEKMDSQAD
jgi:excisionase family DNA binding protein